MWNFEGRIPEVPFLLKFFLGDRSIYTKDEIEDAKIKAQESKKKKKKLQSQDGETESNGIENENEGNISENIKTKPWGLLPSKYVKMYHIMCFAGEFLAEGITTIKGKKHIIYSTYNICHIYFLSYVS